MKKSDLVIIGTLAAALLLSGCEQEPKEPSAAEKAAAALAASADFAGNATVSGATVTLTGDVTLTVDVAVAAGVTLNVADKKLTVPAETKLDVAGALDVAGQLDVAGTLNIEGAVEVAGTIVLQDGSSGSLTGTLTITSTGTSQDLKSGGGSLIASGGGGSVVQAGAKVYNGGSSDAHLLIGGASDTAALLLIESGTFSTVSTGYELDGNATITKKFAITSGQILTVKSGGKFTVDTPQGDTYPGMWLQGSGTKIVGEASAVIEIKSTAGPKGGLIYLTSGGPTSNFYNSEGQLITSGANIDIPRGTYNWDANAGGTGVAGWKAEASG